MPYDLTIREEELKNKIAQDYFWLYDNTKIIGNVDFCVAMHHNQDDLLEQESLLWAEAKKGKADIYKSFIQLILTIGKARTFDKFLPPVMLGVFDATKIAFIPYNDIHDIFYLNDFNWNITPSNHNTREFNLINQKIQNILAQNALVFNYDKDNRELKDFIKNNFVVGNFGLTKTQVDKNNFIFVYNKWCQAVKPSIAVDWDKAKTSDIIDGDFYLADLLSQENETLREKLFVLLEKDKYELDRKLDKLGMFHSATAEFNDNQQAHTQFWQKYQRPPQEQYWDYLIERRDLLVPQDVRERKGSFFTPQIWVELSQLYLKDVLGENWQDEYYIWDCAAGTGNLLTGLTNKYNIYASTLDIQDVEVMKSRIKNGANLLENHVFQFDFLNDDFTKLPPSLQDIINDKEKRKKLVIYINPPYAEATNTKTIFGTGENKIGVATNHKINQHYNSKIGNASNEIFALFMAHIYEKIPNANLAQFSTMKFIQGTNFRKFKEFFQAKFLKGFVVPANTFDNVKGQFPIGFTIWNLNNKEKINNLLCDFYTENGRYLGEKTFYGNLPKSINKWIKLFNNASKSIIGLMVSCPPDFQHNNQLTILSKKQKRYCYNIDKNSMLIFCIYFAVRHCIKATWLNDRDQFLYPHESSKNKILTRGHVPLLENNNSWQTDSEFQNDCLVFTLFHGQNRISAKQGTNHWIAFTEEQVNAKEKFKSDFMTQFINGKIKKTYNDLIDNEQERLKQLSQIGSDALAPLPKVATSCKSGTEVPPPKLKFSTEAKNVFDVGQELWHYYHLQNHNNVNAALYDIKEFFQGRNKAGRMNNKSDDEKYMNLIKNLRENLKILAKKIEPKIYQYGFLKE